MLQRRLAILLSVCMLASGNGSTVYAMNPQASVQTVSDMQGGSDTGEAVGTAGGLKEDGAGNASGNEEGSDDNSGTTGNGSGDKGATTGSETGDNSGAVADGSGDDRGTTEGETGDHGDVAEDESGDDHGMTEDETGDNSGTIGDGTGSEGGVVGDEAAVETGDGAIEDDDSENVGGDVSTGEDEDVAVETDEMKGSLSENSVSVASVKDEELTLTIDAPQAVTLAADEKQWLSFTAPEEGTFRFYSTAEDSSYQYKQVYLYHEKTDNEYGYFDQDYASGQYGNFNITYHMQAAETVWLSVEFNDSSESGTFTVYAEKVAAPKFTMTQNSEGDYTLKSDDYQLNLVLTPTYSTVKAEMELRQADGSALTGDDFYGIYYKYSYDDKYGSTQSGSNTSYLYVSDYKAEHDIIGIAMGGKFSIAELQLRDNSNNILAVFVAGEQELVVNTKVTEKLGVLTQVTAEDASISVEQEMVSNKDGCIRYRKKDAGVWTYYKETISQYTDTIVLAAEPDTDYVIELMATDLETVYDTAEIRTKTFAATDITAEATDITSARARIKINIGSYTGSNQYIRARVSYVDSMGDSVTASNSISASDVTNGITLWLTNLKAGTEYSNLEVELDDTDDYEMKYVAYRTKVSFTTAASAVTAEQISVTVTPDAEDGTKAVLKTALQGITTGTYLYTAKYRIAGSKDWKESNSVSGTLYTSNSFTDEQNLISLTGNTDYEVMVMVDGVSKEASFTTTEAAVVANVEVKPLKQGIEVKAVLTGVSSGEYAINTYYYDLERSQWMNSSYKEYSSTILKENNDWQTTAVFYSEDIRPNATNDWKIKISNDYYDIVYEKYMALEAVNQEVSLTAENIRCTSATIRGKLAAQDESIRYASADLYYKIKGTGQWIKGSSCSYAYDTGGTVYLRDLKEDTEYEVKLVPRKYPDDILAQTTFRTLKDTRSLSVSIDNCRYTSAQINWTFDSGANMLDSSCYICIHYRKKGDSAWKFVDDEWRSTTAAGKELLSDLEPGTAYEVLVELKDTSNKTAGADVVRDVKAEFATAAVDHVLKAELVAEETKPTSVTFTVQLSKPTGTLENRAKAAVTLTPVNGDTRDGEVYLTKENQYQAKLVINDLLPNTKYAVGADLYESESNTWVSLKRYDLGEVTTAEAKTPTSLTISEAELLLNKGTSKRLTVTVQPPEASTALNWTSSDPTIVTVSNGNVTALKAGEADITVTAAGAAAAGDEKVSAFCHVTVRDYTICVKNTDESYESLSGILSKAQKRTLVVYDNAAERDLEGVTWTSSNPHTARIDESGLLEPQNYGKAYITAKTSDNITLKTEAITVVNEIQGFSITRPETDDAKYAAIKTGEAAYQVAAGETYLVGCVLSPAYTDTYSSSISMAGSRFDWSLDNAAVSVKPVADSDMTEIMIPQAASGQVKITATMKDAEYKDKSFAITLDVLKKPEVEALPDTYTYLNYSNRLADAGLPDNWQWKEQDTLLYEAGSKTFTARYVETGYYPYETNVTVQVRNVYGSLSADGNYSAGKKAYIVKKGTPLRVSASVSANSIPAVLYEQTPLAPAAKDAAKVSVSGLDAGGKYNVTASEKGTYTVSTSVGLKKAAFGKQGSEYVLKAGEKVKDTTASLKLMAVDTAPIQKITFTVADDSPEKVRITGDGTIEYKITAANAATKQNERVIRLNVAAADTDGAAVAAPKIDYKVSDTAVVKLKKEGTDKLVLTIPKGADGLAKIVATAKDELGRSAQLAVRVKDYTPRVTSEKVTINENYTYGKLCARVVLPYEEDAGDRIEQVCLVKTNTNGGTDKVAGLDVFTSSGDDSLYKQEIYLKVADKAKIEQRGNLTYYLAIKTKAYGGFVFEKVQIKLETGIPAVTLKQSGKVNVFYTDTTHLTNYDAVSMGLVDVSSSASIESVRWVAGDGSTSPANTEFVIERSSSWSSKNGINTRKYMIQQHKPILDSSKKPSDAAARGTLYIRLNGYKEEIQKPFTIQTVYKKPKLKAADYKVCPALGEESSYQYIYTNAAKSSNWLVRGNSTVWRGYSDVFCADEEVEIVKNSNVRIRYTGAKDKKTQFTFYSDYWYESLTVPVKVKVVNSKVKLSTAAVTLNKVYPTETTQTAAGTYLCNAGTGTRVNVSDIGIVGANAAAQQMLDQSLINMDCRNSYLSVSVNYANAMGNTLFKTGSYKFKLTPYYGDTKLNDVTLTVKIIEKDAAVKVRTKGSIDLVKLNYEGNDYDDDYSPYVTVTPTFQNLDSSYQVTGVELCGAYKDRFKIEYYYSNGTVEILPKYVEAYSRKLKAGKSYALSVKYTVKDAYGEGGETITVTSNTFTIKPKQSVPKVTSSKKQLTLYASAKGYDKGETMDLYVPHDYKKGYYAIDSVYGGLDVDKDGKSDLYVTTTDTYASGGRATIKAYILDADAVKATAKGTAYKIPVTVRCVGSDGVSKNATATVSVLVKK